MSCSDCLILKGRELNLSKTFGQIMEVLNIETVYTFIWMEAVVQIMLLKMAYVRGNFIGHFG